MEGEEDALGADLAAQSVRESHGQGVLARTLVLISTSWSLFICLFVWPFVSRLFVCVLSR